MLPDNRGAFDSGANYSGAISVALIIPEAFFFLHETQFFFIWLNIGNKSFIHTGLNGNVLGFCSEGGRFKPHL